MDINQLSHEIAGLLVQTLVPNNRAAEKEVLKLETSNSYYGLATLQLTRRDDVGAEVHVAAAIAFKNFIRRHWRSDEVDRIDPQQRDAIKQHITKLMLESPALIQRQLSEAITIIGQHDFPDKWPTLIVELETFLKAPVDLNSHAILGILQTAHSIFRRYRYELQSDRLWSEIKLVIQHFGQPFTDRFKEMSLATRRPDLNANQSSILYQSLLLCTKIYHSLITQDLPEFFEDRLHDWLPELLDLLSTQVKLSDDSTVIEDMRSEICEIASLFVQRYSDSDNFKDYTQKFAQKIWTLLVTTDQDIRYDTLVSTAIRYLVTVAERPETRPMFQDANVLNLLCQNVIIPNLTLREIDLELFEDDPEEYVKRDIEGSDVDTRRRAACDLVQALCRFQETQLIDIFGRIIEDLLKRYDENKAINWKLKDLTIYLYSAMAIKGSTRQHGTVSVSQHVNVEKFFEEKIITELLDDSQHPGSNVLKADALRYITTFRNYLNLNKLFENMFIYQRLPLILHITSPNVVVRTYASITVEKLLTICLPNQPHTTAFKPEQFEPFLGKLVETLFNALEMPGSLENEYIMKAIMRLFSFSKSNLIIQFLPIVVPKITNKLGLVARNPSKPNFNHYLFETLALTIRAACLNESPSMRNEFETVLFDILGVVLNQDIQEFTPYVLQLLNIILRAQPVESVSERFVKLFQELLSPILWEKPANITPLTELMNTYIEKIGKVIILQGKLDPLLGIFQKLIASKASDHEALALLRTMMIHLPTQDLDARIRNIFYLIFQRLTGSRTTKFIRHTLITFSLYAHLRGSDVLASAVNQLQDKIFGMVIEKLYLVEVKKVTGYIERRICCSGMVNIVSRLPLIDNGAYNFLWAKLLSDLTEMLDSEIIADDDDDVLDIDDSLDFQAQYSKLIYANQKKVDPTGSLGDLKLVLAVSLSDLSKKLPGFVPKNIQDNLDPAVVSQIMNYCKAANVTIS